MKKELQENYEQLLNYYLDVRKKESIIEKRLNKNGIQKLIQEQQISRNEGSNNLDVNDSTQNIDNLNGKCLLNKGVNQLNQSYDQVIYDPQQKKNYQRRKLSMNYRILNKEDSFQEIQREKEKKPKYQIISQNSADKIQKLKNKRIIERISEAVSSLNVSDMKDHCVYQNQSQTNSKGSQQKCNKNQINSSREGNQKNNFLGLSLLPLKENDSSSSSRPVSQQGNSRKQGKGFNLLNKKQFVKNSQLQKHKFQIQCNKLKDEEFTKNAHQMINKWNYDQLMPKEIPQNSNNNEEKKINIKINLNLNFKRNLNRLSQKNLQDKEKSQTQRESLAEIQIDQKLKAQQNPNSSRNFQQGQVQQQNTSFNVIHHFQQPENQQNLKNLANQKNIHLTQNVSFNINNSQGQLSTNQQKGIKQNKNDLLELFKNYEKNLSPEDEIDKFKDLSLNVIQGKRHIRAFSQKNGSQMAEIIVNEENSSFRQITYVAPTSFINKNLNIPNETNFGTSQGPEFGFLIQNQKPFQLQQPPSCKQTQIQFFQNLPNQNENPPVKTQKKSKQNLKLMIENLGFYINAEQQQVVKKRILECSQKKSFSPLTDRQNFKVISKTQAVPYISSSSTNNNSKKYDSNEIEMQIKFPVLNLTKNIQIEKIKI